MEDVPESDQKMIKISRYIHYIVNHLIKKGRGEDKEEEGGGLRKGEYIFTVLSQSLSVFAVM